MTEKYPEQQSCGHDDACGCGESSGCGDSCGCGDEQFHQMALPPPSLTVLGEMVFTQGMLAAGAVPNPYSQEVEQDLTMAKFQIGLMEILEEKTRGNRSEMESKTIGEMLNALRISYLEASRGAVPGAN